MAILNYFIYLYIRINGYYREGGLSESGCFGKSATIMSISIWCTIESLINILAAFNLIKPTSNLVKLLLYASIGILLFLFFNRYEYSEIREMHKHAMSDHLHTIKGWGVVVVIFLPIILYVITRFALR